MAMSNPDGQAAIPGSLREARNLATIITFSAAELAPGKVHRILSSEDVMEHGSTPVAVYASAQFHDPNPKLYAAAGNEGLDWVERIIRDPENGIYSATPRGMQVHADFMHHVGTLKNQPPDWKYLFWENRATKTAAKRRSTTIESRGCTPCAPFYGSDSRRGR